MLRGRKVTNPTVSAAGGGSHRQDGDRDLNRAWNNIHKVKTELRKIEHRLGESEHRTVLNEIYETSITDYSPRTDLNLTYDAPDSGRAAFVDRHGWTSSARNKSHPNSRKVSRLEDKYQEMDGAGARSKMDKNDVKGTTHGKPGRSGTEVMSNGSRERKYKTGRSDAGPHCVENADGIYGDLVGATGVTNDINSLGCDPLDMNQDTLTDSRAIRETEIRFLNNNLSTYDDVRWGQSVNPTNPNHLTHVSVTVPRARDSYHHERYPVRATHSNQAERERKWEVGSTDSAASDTSSQIGRKLKKTLKDLDFDALSKIKEKIRKQQQRSASPKENVNNNAWEGDDVPEGEMNPVNGPHHHIHSEYEPILSRASYDLPPPDGADSQKRVRKVAAAPTVPSYKGFSEAEVRYKYADFKQPKVMDWRKREKKKKAALKLQEKKIEQATKEAVPEESKPKPKKLTRIVASGNKKPEKQSKKDIITTSSWRAGQELILRELGPAKTRRTSQTSEASVDVRLPATGASNRDNEMDRQEEVTETKSATAIELERAKALSEEARKVLSDLNMGSENEDEERRGKENDENIVKRRRSSKRKASKTSEPEKQLSAKQRHYDQEEVRRFMQKQKADRMKQQREEERRKQRAQEMRSQQLEELRSKQKQTAQGPKRSSKSAGGRGKGKTHDETFTHSPLAYKDLPRHHPFHEDLQSGSMATTDSERERHAGIPPRDEEEMEMSDDSSTLTGESLEAVTPTITPRVDLDDAKPKPKNSAQDRNSVQDGNLNSANVKTLGGLTFNVDGVLSKFSEALHSRGNDINSGYGGSGSSTGSQERPHVYGSEDPNIRSKADRIQAIMNTAATLQQKIQAETSKITGEKPELYNRRALSESEEEGDYVTRYDRITGAQQDFSVFSSNLPGQQRISRDAGPNEETTVESAAIRIQAAYRGHTVRQSLHWRLPSGDTVQTSHRRGLQEEEDTLTETDTISVTVTDELEEVSLTQRKVGSGLQDRDFHAGSRGVPQSDDFVIPRPTHPHSQSNRYSSWDSPSPDPYNVLSIFARHQKTQAGRPRSSASEMQGQQRTAVKEDFRAEPTHSQHSIPSKSTKVTSNFRTQSPSNARNSTSVKGQSAASAGSLRSETSQPVSGSQRNVYKSRSDATHPKVSGYSVTTADSHDSDEDTIEGDSYSQSFDSDEEKHSGKVSKFVSEKSSMKSGFRPVGGSHQASLNQREEVSIDEESPSMSLGRVSPPGEDSESRKTPPRLSPNSLERKFYLELNQLESMEESMRQLTGMERTRAVSMAQQESVSLAQMLKARQEAHEKDMMLLSNKAQLEAMEAMSGLETARLRGTAASQGAEEVLSRLSRPMESSDNIRPRKGSKQSVSHAPESTRSASRSYTQLTTRSTPDTSTRSQSSVEEVKTASDTQRGADSDSSIPSLSKAEGRDDSMKEDSISEELEDYTLDETMTEDEMERSFRSILPSESHRKRAKKQMDNMSVTSDEGSVSAPATPRYSMDDLGSFIGEDSFNKFTEEMVKQFMKEEELRAQHQSSLLKLREKALVEKTKAELSWLEQQKQRIRNKGTDDTYPQINKRQRGLKMRLQEQQAEIKRLQEQNEAASRERQLILQQHEEISRLRNQTQKTKTKIGGRLGRPSEVHTEDEVSVFDEHSDAAAETKLKKDYKSDSEIYTEPKSVGKKGKAEGKAMEKIKKIHLDEKYLTVREQRLHDRRRNVEDLLKWKRRLDEEEEKIYKMEQTALKIWDGDKKDKDVKGSEKQKDNLKPPVRKDKKDTQTYSSIQEDSFVSEAISTAKDDSIKKSVTETPQTELVISAESSPEEVKGVSSERAAKYKTSLGRSASESSIPEEVLSQSSIEEATVTPNRKIKSSVMESSALNDSYGDNTFVDESTMATSRDKVSKKSPRSPLEKLNKQKINIPLAGRDFKTRRHGNRGRSSESESEESISHTDVSTYTETQSDLSDFEGRVRALTEELKRRKIQADKLKKERKKRRKDILKNKEEALKKQIEALDNQIDQLKSEIHNTTEREPSKVRPQILKPSVSPAKKLPEATTPKVVSNDDSGTDSTQSSPSVIEDKDSKPNSPVSKSTPVSSRIPAPLDKISEGSESSRSARRKDDSSVTEEIETAADDSSVSGVLKIPKSPVSEKQPTYKDDDSYSMDFERTPSLAGPPSERPPVSARSTEVSHHKSGFNDQISEAISVVCSEHIDDSVRSESFVKPLDLKKDLDEPISPQSSRPSSEKSEPSYTGRSTDLESASESEQFSAAPSDQPERLMREESVIDSITDVAQNTEDESEQYPVFQTTAKPQEEEDETPINSPRDSSDFSQIDDPMADFQLGDRVSVTTGDRKRRRGQLLFKGKVHFAPGIWAGVELEQPEGKTDGTADGKQYFSCRPEYGIFVPGNDLMPAPTPTPRSISHPSAGSVTDESEEEPEVAEDQDLGKLISEADQNVREFEKKAEKQDKLADLITDQILEKVVSDEVNVLNEISDKKVPPPVAPKPKKLATEAVQEDKENQVLMNGHLSPPESDSGKNSPLQKKIDASNKVVDNLLDDALTKMLKINKKKRNLNNNLKVTQDLVDLSVSPTKELMDVLGREDEEEEEEDQSNVPPRPSSPMPGSSPKNSRLKALDDDINALFDTDLEEDEMFTGLTPTKDPPPYPGTPEPKMDMKKLADEMRIAVPHSSDQVRRIVASAVEIHFQHRTNGESINGLEPPESYFTQEELEDEGLENSSRRVYKKLLFDLTGELLKEIYKNELKEDPPPWQKPKQRRQKYFRGASPPKGVDTLTPIVQEAVIDMLGLNGSRKLDRNKWNVRKKKDHVDNILVQELREEEPEWVNYDNDEIAVKMQLTDNIFETLLTDTVHVMSKIYQKRKIAVNN